MISPRINLPIVCPIPVQYTEIFYPIMAIIDNLVSRWKEWEQIQALELDFTLAESQWSEVGIFINDHDYKDFNRRSGLDCCHLQVIRVRVWSSSMSSVWLMCSGDQSLCMGMCHIFLVSSAHFIIVIISVSSMSSLGEERTLVWPSLKEFIYHCCGTPASVTEVP